MGTALEEERQQVVGAQSPTPLHEVIPLHAPGPGTRRLIPLCLNDRFVWSYPSLGGGASGEGGGDGNRLVEGRGGEGDNNSGT